MDESKSGEVCYFRSQRRRTERASDPGDFPFDLCYVGDGNEVCIEDIGQIIQTGKQPCKSCLGGQTPTLTYSSCTIKDLTAGVEFDIWTGTNLNTGCLWFGYEPAAYAKKVVCDFPGREAARLNEPQEYANPIVDGVQTVVNEGVNFIEENPKMVIGLIVVGVAISYGSLYPALLAGAA